MRLVAYLIVLAGLAAGSPSFAQYAPSTQIAGALGCLKVTVQVARAFAAINPGKCRIVCKGCGCNGGPGYRDTKGDCVGFDNIISLCGPPPHTGCKRECAAVRPQCLGFGRALLVLRAPELGLPLEWDQPGQVDDVEAQTPTEKVSTPAPPAIKKEGEPGNFTCGTKRTCKEMDSCEEAKFYYSQCGLSRLDGTKTGVPCKALCGH